jgi:molecular chaperone DnaK (HSP70)
MSPSSFPIIDTKKKDVVVCIDFGSYGTSFAFGYTNDDTKQVHVENNWEDSDVPYFKNPTQTLYKKDAQKAVAFGFTAEERYTMLEEEEARQYDMIRGFKLALYHSSATVVDPLSGREYQLIDLIAQYLAHINEVVLEKLKKVLTLSVDPSKIKYVITVPAIWSDSANNLMRKALVTAGIIHDEQASEADCMLVLEPESACTFCMFMGTNIGLPAAYDGVVFMVIDAGGGTVDITVHKVENKKLKELTVRSGGWCGSMSIDEKFFKWLKSCFEAGAIDDVFKQSPLSYRQLRNEWEKIKISSKNFDQPKYVSVPDSLKLLIQQGKLLVEEVFLSRTNKLILSPTVQKELFEEALQSVSNLASEQLDQITNRVNFILLVGGFGQCPYLFNRLQDAFEASHRVDKVLQPPQGGLVVVSGGVLLGLDPSLIRSRRARQTYGIEVEEVFDDSKHDEERLICRDNLFLCSKVFFTFVETGQEIDVDAVVERKFDTVAGETKIVIYNSPKKRIKYVDERLVNKLGELSIPAPQQKVADSYVIVTFKFGKVDFHVSAKDHLGNTCKEVNFSFSQSF